MSAFKNHLHLTPHKILWTLLASAVFSVAVFLITQNPDREKSFVLKTSFPDSAPLRLLSRDDRVAEPVTVPPPLELQSPPMSSFLVRRQAERLRFLNPAKLIEVLGIHEGMEILDFGTGSGQYAYLFAEAMKGTGTIYASDIASEQIRYIKQEIKQRGIKNIQPILADGTRFDPFYESIKVDLIFVAHTYYSLDDPEEYFTRLKASLKPGGRLALLELKRIRTSSPFFKPDDITDLPGLVMFLKQNPFKKVPFTLFSPEVLKEVFSPASDYAAATVKEMIAHDFNRMFDSDLLMNAFFDEHGNLDPVLNLPPDEKKYAEWAMRFVKDESPLLEKDSKLLLPRVFKHCINAILISYQFRPFLFDGKGLFAMWEKSPSTVPAKELLPKLGYHLEGEYDFMPFEALVLFSLPQNEGKGKLVAAVEKS